MSRSLSDFVSVSDVKPYIDRVVLMDFDANSSVVNSPSTDVIRDETLKPALAEYISSITAHRDGFPEPSQALVDTYFEAALMRVAVEEDFLSVSKQDRTEAALDAIGDAAKEMIDLTQVLDNETDNEAGIPFTM